MIRQGPQKYHVVHLVESLEVGGMENGIVNLANHMDRERFEVSICCLSHPGALAAKLADSGISHFSLGWLSGFCPRIIATLTRELTLRKADVLHTHGWLTLVYGALASKLAGVSALVNGEHGTFHLDQPRRKLAYRLLSLLVDRFLTVSFSLQDQLIDVLHIPESKIVTIPNGVDAAKFSPRGHDYIRRIKEKLGIPVTAQVIGSTGRLEPVKNYDLLLRAFARITPMFPQLCCLLVGDGSRRQHLEHLASELGIGEKIIFLGKVGNPQDFLPVLDVFVLTSFSEGMSNTILESMSCAKPIVATDVGGNGEMVRDGLNGILVESDNVSQLAEALAQLLRDEGKIALFGSNSRRIVEENYSISSMVSAYEKVYLEILRTD